MHTQAFFAALVWCKHELNSLTVYIIDVLKSERIQWMYETNKNKKIHWNSMAHMQGSAKYTYVWTANEKKTHTQHHPTLKCSQWIITAPVVLARITRLRIICSVFMHFINYYFSFFFVFWEDNHFNVVHRSNCGIKMKCY